jgi:putative spermidine/putrescine transport system substrate-binding protein
MSKRTGLNPPVSRRGFIAGSAAAAAALGMPWVRRAAGAGEFAGKEIRVLTWSDATGQAAVRNILQPFEAETGAKIIPDLTGTTSDMIAKIKASAARPQYDLVILSGFGANTLAEAGLLEKPSLDAIPNLAQVLPDYRTGANGFGVGYFLWSDGLVYNTGAYAQPPKSYGVLWEDANSGKIFLPPADNLYALELIIVAARLAGGDAMNPDPGFAMLGKLKDRALMISSNANQLADLFRSGSLNAGGVYSPLEMSGFIPKPDYHVSGTYDLAEGFFVDLQYMVVPKGHPGDSAVVHALLDRALDPKVQGKMAEEVWYGPINQDAVMSDTAKASPYIPSPAVIKNRTVRVDAAHLASVREDWMKRYLQAVT